MKTKILLLITVLSFFIACKSDKDNASETLNKEQEATQNKEETTASSQANIEEQISEIMEAFKKIENFATSEKKKVTVENVDNQTLELEGYYDDKTLLKLVRQEAGGHSSLKTTYYFKDDKLFFVFEQRTEEASVSGPFTDIEKRVYVSNGEVIRILKKEKTFKKTGKSNLASVPNIDVTNEVEEKEKLFQGYNTQVSEAKKQLKNAFTLYDGRYISEEDSNSGIEIKEGKFIQFYKSSTINSTEIYDFKITKREGSSEGNLTITSTTNNEVYNYTILEHNNEVLKLLYLPRGNMLSYRKEKINLTSFSTFPEEIDGCSCYFSTSKNEFKSGKYIYVDDYDKTAFLYINGEKTIFKLGKAEEPSVGTSIQIGTNKDYELKVETKQVGKIDETWQKKGKLILKSKGKVLIEKEIYGECGC